jgi:hypothetical protein
MTVMRWIALLCLVFMAACGSAPVAPSSSSSPSPVPIGNPLVASLKFKVIDTVGSPAYCDPDQYPVARPGSEEASAIAKYPQIKANATLYAAILVHENLPDGDLTDAQKLIVYRAYKLLNALPLVAAGGDYTFSYRVQKNAGGSSYEMATGTVSRYGSVTLTSATKTGPPVCPICLAAGTLIATPQGPMVVTALKPGMVVWTQSPDGRRVEEPIMEVGSTAVPPGHMMVHVRLADGRELLASPGHRTGDGRALGTLATGDSVDGSTVTVWELVPYGGERTYDLLPAGPTGTYWADGILLSSTLRPSPAG